MRFAIRYCGSCNPHTDLRWIGEKLQEKAESVNAQLVSLQASNIDLMVILCGCPIACADKPETRNLAQDYYAVVAGETVNGIPTTEKDIPEALLKLLTAEAKRKEEVCP